MELLIAVISLLMAVASGVALNRFVEVIDHRAAARIAQAEQPAKRLSTRAEERVGGALERLVPATFARSAPTCIGRPSPMGAGKAIQRRPSSAGRYS